MYKIKTFYIFLAMFGATVALLYCSCDWILNKMVANKYEMRRIESYSIDESKASGKFIKKYSIQNGDNLYPVSFFLIESCWVEKYGDNLNSFIMKVNFLHSTNQASLTDSVRYFIIDQEISGNTEFGIWVNQFGYYYTLTLYDNNIKDTMFIRMEYNKKFIEEIVLIKSD